MYKAVLRVINEPQEVLDDNPDLAWVSHVDHDSDDERTYVNGRTARRNGTVSNAGFSAAGGSRRNNGSHANNVSDTEPHYALLFGRFTFHTRIPCLRVLWRYRMYCRRNPRYKANRWKDTYVPDYPLGYFYGKVMRAGWKCAVAVLACVGSERHRKAWVKDRKWRRRRRFRRTRGVLGEEGDSAGWSTSDGYDEGGEEESEGDGEGVERRDFGLGLGIVFGKGGGERGRQKETRRVSMGSGYWKAGSGVNSQNRGSWRDGEVEAWSNRTRSRVSFVGVEDDVGEGYGAGGLGVDDGWGVGMEREQEGEEVMEEEIGEVPEEFEEMEMPPPPPPAAGRKGKLSWLRMRRRKRQQAVDEENNTGVTGGGVMEERGER